MSGPPVEVWRGMANCWQCDHLGHMNTRFYLAIVEEGLAALGFAVAPVRAQHMRFHREAQAGAALHATGQIISDGDLLFVLRHSETKQVAATFRLWVGAGDTWPTQAEIAQEARPRSVSLENLQLTASVARADQLRLPRTGLGVIMPEVCDARGIWRLSGFMGRIADCVSQLPGGDWRAVLERTAAVRVGGALVEFQTVHARWPRLGERCEVRSGLAGCTDRVTYAVHWLLDPSTGEPHAAVRAVGVPLDLQARRSIALTPEAQAAYRAVSIPGLEL
jgi:acyl-CoA thioester hydrolase